jgi:hypothetical protein
MHHFCTYFDSGYLARGLALYHSLERHVPQFKLHIFCLDDITYDILTRAEFAKTTLVRLVDLEAFDRDMLATRGRRSQIEYYFTMTSVLPKYLFEAFPDIDAVTYIDADLLFFSDPEPIFEEIGDAPVGITPHRFTPANQELIRFGVYNVGWLTWRRDPLAQECLDRYRNKSIEWCYDSVEDDRYADQKYLDDWTSRFPGVHSIHHKGANLAPWNNGNYQFSMRRAQLRVDDDPLIFYHFHGLKSLYKLDPEQTSVKWYLHGPVTFDFDLLMKAVYQPYVDAMCAAREELKAFNLASLSADRQIRHTDAPPFAATSVVWRRALDWEREEEAKNDGWRMEAIWPDDQQRALAIRKLSKMTPEFDGGYLGRIARTELLISVATATLKDMPLIVDLSEGDDLIDHALEFVPRLPHRKWIAVASSEVINALRRHLPNLSGTSEIEAALAQAPDILLAGHSIAHSYDWQGEIRHLASSSAWLILNIRTFSGTPTTLIRCRDVGAKTPRCQWILNRLELLSLFRKEGLAILREIVTPDPVRIKDIPELADRRLFLIACKRSRDSS